jgi:PIN domain nuclease of toxin-antitoxin system
MRRLLLDTHILLWWLADNKALGKNARALIAAPGNEAFVSAVSSWEISIKKMRGLLQAPDDIDAIVEEEGFGKLPITLFHGERAGALPEIHRDPFDRMLIAQAQAEGLEIITSDSEIPRYGIKIIDGRK